MHRRSLPILLAAASGAVGAAVLAQDEVFTDPAGAPLDFRLQGEYAGQAGKRQWGLQVVALGGGSFAAQLLPGGLPGSGWDGRTRIAGAGTVSGEGLKLQGEGWDAQATTAGALTGRAPGGDPLVMRRVERQSPTLGLKPPPEAKILFNGSGVDAWRNGKSTNDGLLRAGARTTDRWRSMRLHLEFRTPFQPRARGQARGNSGVFVADLYEIQILDSFGLEGKNNECGGVYSQAAPTINMCLPPLTWQTYDIDFTAARIAEGGKVTAPARLTLRHNGVVVHNDLELKATPGGGRSAEDGQPGALYIQDHGDPVVLRNIWLLPSH